MGMWGSRQVQAGFLELLAVRVVRSARTFLDVPGLKGGPAQEANPQSEVRTVDVCCDRMEYVAFVDIIANYTVFGHSLSPARPNTL